MGDATLAETTVLRPYFSHAGMWRAAVTSATGRASVKILNLCGLLVDSLGYEGPSSTFTLEQSTQTTRPREVHRKLPG